MSDFPLPLPYSDDVETIPADEAADIERVNEALRQILARTQAKTGKFTADVHVKTIGCATAGLRVLPNLPEELSQGLFERERSFAAVVRFSNASGQPLPDALPDGRGLAIKVLGVQGGTASSHQQPGESQDFVLINHPVFFARNVKDYLRLEQVLAEAVNNPLTALPQVLTGGDWNPLNWHWREVLTAARIAGQLPTHPASQTYYSMSPFRFGQYVAKFRARPAGDRQDSYLELIKSLGTQADGLRLALEATLRAQEILFEFQVQLRTSVASMPIEDATIEWPESESPYRTVGHLLLPRQEIAPPQQQALLHQELSFDVWNGLPAHRPLGGINRVRRSVYPISSAWRQNGPQM